ncbi:MAG: phosphate signaling complex protein PhoU [Pseudomonadota bacterium]|nr:phosphate signaling complex protein PhoU [Pseudomonadota bacterium]
MENLHIDQHISRKYNEELEGLRNKVMIMGGMVEKQSRNALEALIKGDSKLAETVATSDYRVNSMEVEIDAECTDILARRQPAASDLRMIITVIKTITDLERIGDEAEKIGRFALKLANNQEPQSYYSELHHLGEHVIEMLHGALDAFARMDVEAAVRVAGRDPEIDQEFEALTRMLITHMMEDPREVKNVLRLNWCARSLERIGDHSANICEYVIYLVKGHDVRHVRLEQIQEQYIQKK